MKSIFGILIFTLLLLHGCSELAYYGLGEEITYPDQSTVDNCNALSTNEKKDQCFLNQVISGSRSNLQYCLYIKNQTTKETCITGCGAGCVVYFYYPTRGYDGFDYCAYVQDMSKRDGCYRTWAINGIQDYAVGLEGARSWCNKISNETLKNECKATAYIKFKKLA